MTWLARPFRNALAWFQGQEVEPTVRPVIGLSVARTARESLEALASQARRDARAEDCEPCRRFHSRLADDLDEAAIELSVAIEEAGF